MPLAEASRIPRATYRVQLHRGFSLRDLENQTNFLHALGVSDFYLSPIFTATPGSTHGYDVSDYRTINAELGGEEAFHRLTRRLRELNIGVVLDVVPNHMGIAGPLNAWWRDVLERGQHSAYATFFDIHWHPSGDRDDNRVLVPLLEDHYGKVLEEGKIRVEYGRDFALRYRETSLPLRARSYATILRRIAGNPALSATDSEEAAVLAAAFLDLPETDDCDRLSAQNRADAALALKTRFSDWMNWRPHVRECLQAQLDEINGRAGDRESFASLNALIEEQHYRLARWKTGAHEINYRRFFAIDTLVGLRVESKRVFTESHALLARLIATGEVTGLRIDHIDGLRQPFAYLRRLQELERPDSRQPLYLIVEKILARGESLPVDWPVNGTTGYEFIAGLAEILVDPEGAQHLDETYRRFTGDTMAYADAVYTRKRQILDELFANAVNHLGGELAEIVSADRRWRDLTRSEVIIAVREIIAGLPSYRTYRRAAQPVSESERAMITTACAAAVVRNPRFDPEPFEFVRDVLVGTYDGEPLGPEFHARLLDWVLTFQQYTGAVMAKSVEDTVFYTYNRFIALNEVGSDPGAATGSVADFHAANQRRLEELPQGLLTTSTHDSKMSEDVRARLYALSEIPLEWSTRVEIWHRLNRIHRTAIGDGEAPDRLDEYRFYQSLLGVWPLDPGEVNDDLRSRLRTHLRKAVEEAKRHTSPLQPNEPYLAACDRFVDGVTDVSSASEFLASFIPCAERLARLGLINSLSQLVLKCTLPGVPDFYQGNEIWEFSLVDPDNRRPIDYRRRHRLLAAMESRSCSDLLAGWRDGGIKLRTMQALLELRAREPELFSRGAYLPLPVRGTWANHVVAFARKLGSRAIVVVIPRCASRLGLLPVGSVWDDTVVVLDHDEACLGWRDILTAASHGPAKMLPLRHLFATLPFAVLECGTTEASAIL